MLSVIFDYTTSSRQLWMHDTLKGKCGRVVFSAFVGMLPLSLGHSASSVACLLEQSVFSFQS